MTTLIGCFLASFHPQHFRITVSPSSAAAWPNRKADLTVVASVQLRPPPLPEGGIDVSVVVTATRKMADVAVTQDAATARSVAGAGSGSGHSATTDQCSKQRHWYMFLCSSLITFFACLFLVLLGRIVTWLCCGGAFGTCLGGGAPRRKLESATDDGGGGPKHSAAVALLSGGEGDGNGNRQSDAEGGSETAQIGWATEAKDWAGELISGQTTTGRILVRYPTNFNSLPTVA